MLKPIEWTGECVRLLDQTKLPGRTEYVEITNEKQMHDAIRRLVVRGAPAIGIAAAFGVYLGVRDCTDDVVKRLKEVAAYLATARPTAVNLFWALQRIQAVAEKPAASPRDAILRECLEMIEEDHRVCRAIGRHGLELLRSGARENNRSAEADPTGGGTIEILTHCNAGGLATAGYGTALAPIYLGVEEGLKFHVYADETRPLLQGSRITAYELKENGIPVTVICDSMAASVMSAKRIDAIFVGADRIAANGDTANKVGTLPLAIAARHFKVPFYVAAPISTIDLATTDGRGIPIEQRAAEEVTRVGDHSTAPQGVDAFNPAFDVTPADLIDAIVTENGVARAPYGEALRKLAGRG